MSPYFSMRIDVTTSQLLTQLAQNDLRSRGNVVKKLIRQAAGHTATPPTPKPPTRGAPKRAARKVGTTQPTHTTTG